MDIDLSALRLVERDREIPFAELIEIIEAAIVAAYQRSMGNHDPARAAIDLKTGKIEETLGTLRTVAQRTKPKTIQSIMLVSGIKHKDADGKILNNIKASGIAVSCHHDAIPDLNNRNFFKSN